MVEGQNTDFNVKGQGKNAMRAKVGKKLPHTECQVHYFARRVHKMLIIDGFGCEIGSK
jgi:hypothetical protein